MVLSHDATLAHAFLYNFYNLGGSCCGSSSILKDRGRCLRIITFLIANFKSSSSSFSADPRHHITSKVSFALGLPVGCPCTRLGALCSDPISRCIGCFKCYYIIPCLIYCVACLSALFWPNSGTCPTSVNAISEHAGDT